VMRFYNPLATGSNPVRKPGNRIEKFLGCSVDVDQGTLKYSYL